MAFGSFLYRENKNFPFRKPLVKAATRILSSASSIESASLLNQVMYNLNVSSFHYLMLIKHAVDFLYLCPPMKFEVNWALNSLKVLIEFSVNLLNQILAAPFSIVRKALHMISFGIPWRCIRVLKVSR